MVHVHVVKQKSTVEDNDLILFMLIYGLILPANLQKYCRDNIGDVKKIIKHMVVSRLV